MHVIEIIVNIILIITAIVSFATILESGKLFPYLPILVSIFCYTLIVGHGLFLFEKKSIVPTTETIAQEFQSKIEYRNKEGELIYSITDIGEYKNKQNISGFTKIEKYGWGPDKTSFAPIFNLEAK